MPRHKRKADLEVELANFDIPHGHQGAWAALADEGWEIVGSQLVPEKLGAVDPRPVLMWKVIARREVPKLPKLRGGTDA